MSDDTRPPGDVPGSADPHQSAESAPDPTMLRPSPSSLVTTPGDTTQLRPSPTSLPPGDTTQLRPSPTSLPPADTTQLRPGSRDLPAPSRQAWAATHLPPPPSGSLPDQVSGAPDEPPGWTPPSPGSDTSAFSPESDSAGQEPVYVPEVKVPQIRKDVLEPLGEIRYQAPADPPPPPQRRSPVQLWMVLTAALVVAATVAGVLVWRSTRPVWIDPAIPGNEPAKIAYQRGDQVVAEYLNALATGDIKKALALGPKGGSGSEVLLQEAAVRASIQDAPISSIQVPPADENASLIHASYQVGSQAVPAVFRVARDDDRSWRLAKATTTVEITARRSSRLPLYINGIEIPPNVNQLELVPGSYTLSTQLPFVAYLPDTKFTVQNLDYTNPIKDLPVVITEAGSQALVKASRTSLNNCMNSHALSPPNCPFRWEIPTGFEPDLNTMSYTPSQADAVSGATWTVSASDQALAQTVVRVAGKMTIRFKGQPTLSENAYDGQWTITADITKLRAEDLDVQWNKAR